jgi:hypothetical protein
MKVFNILLISFLVVGLVGTVDSPTYENNNEYVKVSNDRLAASCKDNQEIIKGWSEGIKKEFGCDLDHLEAIFVPIKVGKTEENRTILLGPVTTTAYSYRNQQKVRIVLVNMILYLMNKDKIIENFVIIEPGSPKMVPGWVSLLT